MQPRFNVIRVAAISIMAVMSIFAIAIGLSQPQGTVAAPTAPNDVVIAIYDFYFDPPEVYVSPGTTVIWQNWGEVTHTVSITGQAASGDIPPGASFSHTFNSLGTFPYQCNLHPEMQGVVRAVYADQVPVDLAVTAWHDQVVAAGAQIDYHVEYYNRDWSFRTQDAVVTVGLPAAGTLITSTMEGAPYPPDWQMGNMLFYTLGALDPAASNTIDLVVQVPNTLTVNSEVMLTGNIASPNPDPNLDNNYTADIEAIPGANMTISKRLAFDSGPFVAGGVVTYSLQYLNLSSYVDATVVMITDHLPSGVHFLSALQDDWTNVTPIVPITSSGSLVFNLGAIQPGDGGQLLVQAQLDTGLYAKTELVNIASVATAATETSYDDNSTSDTETVVPTLPDLWVDLYSSTDGQIDGYQFYSINLGNSGPLDAHNVQVSLSIPRQLTELNFNAEPTTLVTRTSDYLATWNIGLLPANEGGAGLNVSSLISVSGQITATVTITSTSAEADPSDNRGLVSDFNAEILMPTITGPSTAIVGQQPVFFGLGQPDATVTLYLSGTIAVPGRLLGSDVVDNYGRWMITPTSSISPAGWYWFTATQQLNNRISPVTGVGNFVTDTLIMDTNSMVRYLGASSDSQEPERLGGINQPMGWRRETTYTLGVQLTRCAPNEPVSPTLQVLLYNDDGLMVSYQDIAGTVVVTSTGDVEFEFMTPDEESFELFINYYCPVTTVMTGAGPSTPLHPSGWWQDLKDWFSCWESLGCDKPDPPPPPKPGCPGCTPIPRPRPRPKPTDPDGFIYDCSLVRSGATITQSIITQAWVTATQRTGAGLFTPWNAFEFDQANPQYTDNQYPDKVLKPGYYSFLVPSGDYRIQAVAPGYVPFESQVLRVTNSPVTLNIPLKRPGDVGVCTPSVHLVYLPLFRR
ncbi:MAG TPA: hypothetical protein VMP08_04200 [Anaerolineae bacterium]|nr:hypothetical protein [Anaerolineae bacterium]